MVTALVMLTVERNRINDVAEMLADVEGIREVYSVTGKYDLVAVVWVKDNDALAEVVTGRMLKVNGILTSETVIAFRVFSKHDLETLFAS